MTLRISVYNIYEYLNEANYIFRNKDSAIGDDLLTPFVELKAAAEKRGYLIGTPDVVPFECADAILFCDYPSNASLVLEHALKARVPLYLLALESPLINPDNQAECKHSIFKNVFTWNDKYVAHGDDKYRKINYSFKLPRTIDIYDEPYSRKLCTMIAGNKQTNAVGELYSKRIDIIEWFESNHPDDLDLYGTEWDSLPYYLSGNKRILNKFPILRKLFAKNYTAYKGRVLRKKDVLNKYNFSICYENMSHQFGYITEKIFDSFFSACIPIYLGAENVQFHIPEECYIDARDFQNIDDLYRAISSMSNVEIMKKRKSIRDFLASNACAEFGCEHFVNTVLDVIASNEVAI